MAQVLCQLPTATHPDLLVGTTTGDDAAVYKLRDDLAVVLTVDFFPPIVDDPFTFGEIAAANSMSDIYAMGGTPILGLNVVGFPADLDNDILAEILKGGASKAAEAGMLIVGGHTVIDSEPKYGMAVTGVVSPGLHVTNNGAKSGDSLVLTKPIGTGIITTAIKQRRVDTKVAENAVKTMNTLNAAASQAMLRVGVNACSDVTGFGLLGHLREMVASNNNAALINMDAVPVIQGTWELLEHGIAPGGTERNLSYMDNLVEWPTKIDKTARLLLCDAQTSGGLLISVDHNKLDTLIVALRCAGVETQAVIGEIIPRSLMSNGRLIKIVA